MPVALPLLVLLATLKVTLLLSVTAAERQPIRLARRGGRCGDIQRRGEAGGHGQAAHRDRGIRGRRSHVDGRSRSGREHDAIGVDGRGGQRIGEIADLLRGNRAAGAAAKADVGAAAPAQDGRQIDAGVNIGERVVIR